MDGRSRAIWGTIGITLLWAAAAAAMDRSAMEARSDGIFRGNGIAVRTVCGEKEAVITLDPESGGKHPPVDLVIETLAAVGKAFHREYGAGYFYRISVYADGRKWIETLAGNCKDSYQDNTVSHCYYKVNF